MSRSLLLIASLFLLGTTHAASAADGKALYEATCIACHGPAAQGAIPGVPDLAKSGILSKPDAELVANILNGFQSKGSPMAMPPKGGNPNLTAADASALLTYMRVLTGTPARPAGAAPAPADASAAAVAPAPTRAAMPATATATATATAAETATAADMAGFARGASAWANTCARCHGMRDPKDLTDRQWKVVATHMRLRAGLDGQEVRDITAFLQGSN